MLGSNIGSAVLFPMISSIRDHFTITVSAVFLKPADQTLSRQLSLCDPRLGGLQRLVASVSRDCGGHVCEEVSERFVRKWKRIRCSLSFLRFPRLLSISVSSIHSGACLPNDLPFSGERQTVAASVARPRGGAGAARAVAA